ncbi:MAG: helix-turn-helix domain-containing protein [Saprospiraceae bacterium]
MDNLIAYKVKSNHEQLFNETGFLHLIWLTNGKAKISLDLKEITMETNQIFMILPDAEFVISTYTYTDVILLRFTSEMLEIEGKDFVLDVFRLFVSNYNHPKTKVSSLLYKKINILARMMIEENPDNNSSFPILQSYLKIILLSLIEEKNIELSIPDKNIERMQDFFKLVHNYSFNEKRVTFYANKLNITTTRLNQILKEFTNKSASFFIREHLILSAKKLLITGKYSVNEVSYELGFEDRAYFSRFFKNWVGLPPEKYKLFYFKNKKELLYKDGLMNINKL